MGYRADNDRIAAEVLADIEDQDRRRRVPREIFMRPDAPAAVDISGPVTWRVTLEGGRDAHHQGRSTNRIELPPLLLGLHRLEVEHEGGVETALLMVAPDRVPSLSAVAGVARLWGVTAPLYGLRSGRNLGVGDYADLGAAAEALALHGADFLGINPVHARGTGSDIPISPYSPTHRARYSNTHIAVDRIPGFALSDAARQTLAEGELDLLRSGELVDYEAAAALRSRMLRKPSRPLSEPPNWQTSAPNSRLTRQPAGKRCAVSRCMKRSARSTVPPGLHGRWNFRRRTPRPLPVSRRNGYPG